MNGQTRSLLPLFPEQASSVAASVDALYFFLVAVSVFFTLVISISLLVFAVRYRRRGPGTPAEAAFEPAPPSSSAGTHGPGLLIEITWTLIPLGLTMVMFVWGASLFFRLSNPPTDSMEIYTVGKQWMWKFQHPEGRREINELHVPLGRPVKLMMSSEDVIHSFFVPAFRVKADVLPGRYRTAWFEATRTGTYHLFCAEYCGTQHSRMIGTVTVMEPAAYEAWLGGGVVGEPVIASGSRLYQSLGCTTCHVTNGQGRGPSLVGVFGRPVQLRGGQIVIADESYLRESIVNPAAKIVDGYEPLMPAFQGMVSEEQLLQLIAYIKSLRPEETTPDVERREAPARAAMRLSAAHP